MGGIISKSNNQPISSVNTYDETKKKINLFFNNPSFDQEILKSISQFQDNAYYEQLMNLEIPTGGAGRNQLLEKEKALRFATIFEQELKYRNQLTPSLFTHLTEKDINEKIKENKFNMFLKAVRHGYIALANKLLTDYPEFLEKKGDIDHKLNDSPPLKNKNALECACYEGDVEMIEMLLTHYKHKEEALKILDQYYPDKTLDPAFIESKEEKDTLFNFNPITKIIDDNKAILKKYNISIYIQREENLINQNTADDYTKKELEILKKATPDDIKIFEAIRKEIDTYKGDFVDYETAQNKNIALKNTLESLNIYNENYFKWNFNQRILFWSNIFGFVERRLAVPDGFEFCQLRQSLTVRNYTQKNTIDLPFFSHFLGSSFGIYSGAGRLEGLSNPPNAARLKTYIEQKLRVLRNLKEQIELKIEQNSRYVMS